MTEVRILEADTDRIRADWQEGSGIDAGDEIAWLLILTRACDQLGLGDPDSFRIQIWDQRKGWIQYSRT